MDAAVMEGRPVQALKGAVETLLDQTIDKAQKQLDTLKLERQMREEQADEAAPLTPAEKRDARRAAKALKKLQAEDAASAEHKERVRGVALENGIPTGIADQVAQETDPTIVKAVATNKQLIAFIERVENVELELAERSEDRKQIYAEARSCGFDVPTMKKIVAMRKMDEADRLQAEALLATYMHAVGLTVQTEMKF